MRVPPFTASDLNVVVYAFKLAACESSATLYRVGDADKRSVMSCARAEISRSASGEALTSAAALFDRNDPAHCPFPISVFSPTTLRLRGGEADNRSAVARIFVDSGF